MLNGHLLHQQNYTGSGKILAVLDAGFPGVDTQLPFKKLRDNNQISGGYNYVNRSANYYLVTIMVRWCFRLWAGSQEHKPW